MKLRSLLKCVRTFMMVSGYIVLVQKDKKAKYRLDAESFYNDDGFLGVKVFIMKKNADFLGPPKGVFWFKSEASDFPICAKYGIDLDSEDWEIRNAEMTLIQEKVELLQKAIEEVQNA